MFKVDSWPKMHTVATSLFTYIVKLLDKTTVESLITPEGVIALKLVYRSVY